MSMMTKSRMFGNRKRLHQDILWYLVNSIQDYNIYKIDIIDFISSFHQMVRKFLLWMLWHFQVEMLEYTVSRLFIGNLHKHNQICWYKYYLVKNQLQAILKLNQFVLISLLSGGNEYFIQQTIDKLCESSYRFIFSILR